MFMFFFSIDTFFHQAKWINKAINKAKPSIYSAHQQVTGPEVSITSIAWLEVVHFSVQTKDRHLKV